MKTKILLKLAYTICLIVLLDRSSFANNISVSNVSLNSPNIQNHYVMIKFDIQWDNSWRTSSAPNNWDAAWVYIKYRVNSGQWLHAWLNNTGHFNPAGSTISTGLLNPGLPFDPVNNPGMGAFIYRDTDGTGTFSKIGVQIRWNYGANGLNDNDIVDIRLYAIEQVYVPQGSFYIGSGGTEASAFYKYPSAANPYQITSENEIPLGTTNDYLYYNYSAEGGDQLGPVPAVFQKVTMHFIV
jgi:hypothetical protein